MGKLNAFIIQLQHQDGIYYPGQAVNGQVDVDLKAEMKMREIRLKFDGSANVYWTETHEEGSGDDRRTVTETYSAHENYFTFNMVLYGKTLGQSDRLGAGKHTFPFQFILPAVLPSSFEHSLGQVRYTLRATIDKPWKFNHTTKQMMTVVSLLDLNTLPQALVITLKHKYNHIEKNGTILNISMLNSTLYLGADLSRKENKKVVLLLYNITRINIGPITGVVKLEKSGYVPGEAMHLLGEVQNLSNTPCSVEVKLKGNMLFHATSKTNTQTQQVTALILDTSDPGETQIFSGRRIVTPSVPPSYLAGCNIIDIRYYVELHINPCSISSRLVVPVEVIIGSIPLQSVYQQYRPPPGPITPHDVNINFVGEATPIPSAPDMPPPSYAECVFGKSNIRDKEDNEYTKGQMEYAPAYPYYNLS